MSGPEGEARRARRREAVQRHRSKSPEYVERNRMQIRAAGRALRKLKEAHPDEYASLYAAERQRLGLD